MDYGPGLCPKDCKELEPLKRSFSSMFCRKYQRMIHHSNIAKGLVRLPKCITDESSNQLDKD